MRIIAFANNKGGVGKTTCCHNIGSGLWRKGKSVLMIDLDPQGAISASCGLSQEMGLRTTKDFLFGSMGQDCIYPIKGNMNLTGLVLMPAGNDLGSVEHDPDIQTNLLRDEVGQYQYDYILIDCPPTLSLLTVMGLVAAKEVFVPLSLEFLPLRGLSALIRGIDLVKEKLNPELEITGVIGTRVNERKILSRNVLEQVRGVFGDRVFETMIRENVSLAEAPSFGKDIFEYKPDSIGAEDFGKLVEEITSTEEKHNAT